MSARLAFLEQAALVLRGIASAPTVEVGEDRLFGDVGTLPWVGLLPAPGSLVERDLHDDGASITFRVLLYGYVQGDGVTSRTAKLLAIVEESQRALHSAVRGPFAAPRPGSEYAYADDLTFESEDLTYHREGTGAEFLIPLVVRIPDTLAA